MKIEAGACCPRSESLFAYLDQTLNWRQKRATDIHLKKCSTCQEQLSAAQQLQQFHAGLGDVGSNPWAAEDTRRWSRRVHPSDTSRTTYGEEAPVPPLVHGLTFLRPLASGGFADVWLARDEASVLAVKVVREHSAQELEALQLYKSLADSPDLRLMPIHHIGRCEQSGRLYYTMAPADPLDGRAFDTDSYRPATLQATIERTDGLPLPEVLKLAGEILDTLHGLHVRGLVHRDVKPTNVLRYHGRWCLADTGLLAREDELSTRPVAGTPDYMPREMRNDDRSCDLYAFGRTLYQALAEDLDAFPTPRPAQLQDGIDRLQWRRLYQAIEHACSNDPAERYRSARQMALDLTVSAPRRRRQPGMLAAVLGMAVLGAAALSWHLATRSPSGSAQAVALAELPQILVQPPAGDPVVLGAGQRLLPGWSMWVRTEVPEELHHALVLAWYSGATRSVFQFAPERRQPLESGRERLEFAHSSDADGGLVGFRIPAEPSPVLVLVLSRPEAFEPKEAETAVEELLGDLMFWPPDRERADALPAQGSTLATIRHSVVSLRAAATASRGGERPKPGEVVRGSSGPLQLVVDQLSTKGATVNGTLLEIGGLAAGD